jgi:hypothetical protein
MKPYRDILRAKKCFKALYKRFVIEGNTEYGLTELAAELGISTTLATHLLKDWNSIEYLDFMEGYEGLPRITFSTEGLTKDEIEFLLVWEKVKEGVYNPALKTLPAYKILKEKGRI